MTTYNSNYELAQEISARLGTEPIPFESVLSLCHEIYTELGGDEEQFDNVYEILLEILPLARQTNPIDDSVIALNKTWSSNKINTELSGKQNTLVAGSGITISGDTISAECKSYNEGQNITIDSANTISADGYVYNESKQSVAEGTSKALGNYSHSEGQYTEKTIPVTFSGAANATILQASGSLANMDKTILCLGCIVTIDESVYTHVIDIDTINNTITLYKTLSASEALSGATLKSVWGVAYGTNAHAEGNRTSAFGNNSHTEGENSVAALPYCHAEGVRAIAFGRISHAEGYDSTAIGEKSHVEGTWTVANNKYEHAGGVANISHKASDDYLNSGNTLFSIGNGTTTNSADAAISTQSNAVEIMQNADMYIKGVGNYDGIHIKGEVSGTTVQTLQEAINSKADAYETATTAEIDLLFGITPPEPTQPNDEIWYTSYSGDIVEPSNTDGLPTIISNTYNNGKGIIKFATPLTSIEDGFHHFVGCEFITVSLPNSLMNIPYGFFQECEYLETVTLPSVLTNIDYIPALDSNAFAYCPVLTSVNIPEGVTILMEGTFQECYALSSVTLPNGLISIDGAFIQCDSLTTITLPASLTYISGFWDALTSITCEATTPPVIGYMGYTIETLEHIYVPAESVNAYKVATGWSDYANIIQAIQ